MVRYGQDPKINIIIGFSWRDRRSLQILKEVLKSFHRQRYRNFELAVVEQDVRPRHIHTLRKYGAKYIFAYNPGKYNRGWGRNVGAKLCRDCDYLLFNDADIPVPDDFLLKSVQCITRKKIDFLCPFTKVYRLTQDATKTFVRSPYNKKFGLIKNKDNVLEIWDVPEAVGGSVFVGKKFFFRINGYYEDMNGWGCEDECIWDKSVIGNRVKANLFRMVHLYHEQSPKDSVEKSNFEENCKKMYEMRKLIKKENLTYKDVRHVYGPFGGDINEMNPGVSGKVGVRKILRFLSRYV